MPLKTRDPFKQRRFSLTQQLSAASTKSYMKAIYLLLLHYLPYLEPADQREMGLNGLANQQSAPEKPVSRGTAELRVPAGSREGDWR